MMMTMMTLETKNHLLPNLRILVAVITVLAREKALLAILTAVTLVTAIHLMTLKAVTLPVKKKSSLPLSQLLPQL